MENEKFDPRNEEYKEVSDLPESMKEKYRDIPSELGKGFVTESALRNYQNALDIAKNNIRIDGSVFDKANAFFGTKKYFEQINASAIDTLERHADHDSPVEQIVYNEGSFLWDKLYGEAWDNMRECLPNKGDYIFKDGDNYFYGVIGGKDVAIKLLGKNQYMERQVEYCAVNGEYVDRSIGKEVLDSVRDAAIDKNKIATIVGDVMTEEKNRLKEEYDDNPEMLKSKNQTWVENREKDFREKEETEYKEKSDEARSSILDRIQKPK